MDQGDQKVPYLVVTFCSLDNVNKGLDHLAFILFHRHKQSVFTCSETSNDHRVQLH